jgi:hypothetical protein
MKQQFMADSDKSEDVADASKPPWRLLGVGGALSLCCLFAAPAGGAAAAGGTAAALGGGLTRVLVTAITVGVIGLVYRIWSSGSDCHITEDAAA